MGEKMKDSIEKQLKEGLSSLSPSYLLVENESYMHAVPKNSETHFKVTIVADVFRGLNRVKQHQKIYAVSQPLMQQGLHALALHSFTPEEWLEKTKKVAESPLCSKNK